MVHLRGMVHEGWYIFGNAGNKTSTFPILKQYYTKLSFNFIIYSNEESISVVIGRTRDNS